MTVTSYICKDGVFEPVAVASFTFEKPGYPCRFLEALAVHMSENRGPALPLEAPLFYVESDPGDDIAFKGFLSRSQLFREGGEAYEN